MSSHGIFAASWAEARDDGEALITPLSSQDDAGGFMAVSDAAAAALYRRFLILRGEPVFVDIFKPIPYHTAAQFTEYFSAVTRPLWVMGAPEAPSAYFCLHYLLRQHDMGNLDFAYFDGCPGPGSEAAVHFWNDVRYRSAELGLTRMQCFVIDTSIEKMRLLESFGFRREGVLREHYFHNGALHDLIVYAWLAAGRCV